MTAYGPSLVGAFGSSDISQAAQLHCLLRELMRRSSLNSDVSKMSNIIIDERQGKYVKSTNEDQCKQHYQNNNPAAPNLLFTE